MEEGKNASNDSTVGVEDQAHVADGAASHEASDSVEISDSADQLAAIAAERDALAAEKSALSDRLIRFQAEFDNFRKRVDRERMEMLEYASVEAVRSMLPIADDLERALKVESADKVYARGMEMVYQRLDEALKKLGLEPLTTEGERFDPNLHHAVTKIQSDEYEDGAILEEYQKGYNFKGRLLRPAMVKVAVRP
jgi:molecular chaperone GrpE